MIAELLIIVGLALLAVGMVGVVRRAIRHRRAAASKDLHGVSRPER